MSKKSKFPPELDFIRAGRLPQKKSNESMEGKICVITGTTSGVGYQAAIRLAKAGAKIVMIVRNKEKAENLCAEIKTLSSYQPDYYIADFADLSQVKTATESILKNYPHIDVLINNAGVHMTRRKLTVDGHETAFAVNHLAAFLITSLLLKRMVESSPSRIIQVNSEGHRFKGLKIDDLNWEKRRYGGYRGYGASKTAQLMTVWELSDLLQNTGVTINAMHPGAVKSNIGTNNGKMYNFFSRFFIQPTLKNPVISGDAIYYLASSPEMNDVSGKFFNLTNEEIPAPHATNREIGKEIFQLSKKLVNLDNENVYEV
ncbi:MAG: SDR family NAD(P)-dependent oxidoreductase [Bacteroidales bacterium]|nr:SDR family NAD(P)-dependent oxidoreductase [Bacteroidales bacterium]